jgi:ABC-2 type transport system ATP-binding protein
MLLRTEQLTKSYGSFRALDGLDLAVAPGEVVGLLGPNGSGKSTALRLLLGFLRPSSGQASIAGHDCWQDSAQARRHVGYLPGELRLYENMTGAQLVRLLCDLRQQPPHDDRLKKLAGQFDIDLSRPIAQLSSGMKRKVALLQVLVPETPLVILDEPTNTLDPNMRDELLVQLVEAKGRGQAVLFSSHVLSEVERICDRVAILHQGKLAYVQDMRVLRESVHVSARLDKPCLPPPSLAGLTVRQHTDTHLDLNFGGALPELLRWLAGCDVRDLKIEAGGLADIYQRFHPTP